MVDQGEKGDKNNEEKKERNQVDFLFKTKRSKDKNNKYHCSKCFIELQKPTIQGFQCYFTLNTCAVIAVGRVACS